MQSQVVLGLQFGDEGKGATVDYLCSISEHPMVVRMSGGQNCGHTVMINDKKHVHSNYGSGTLRGAPSYFTEHCSVYLNTLNTEKEILQELEVNPILYVHPLAKLTTPYDVAYNRAREKCVNHGSCGLGIASTMKRHNESGYKLFVMDLYHDGVMKEKLKNIEQYYKVKMEEEGIALDLHQQLVLNSDMEKFNKLVYGKNMFEIQDYSIFEDYNLIFEGSQGILLDMDHGIFPNVTYAHTTSRNAIEILDKLGFSKDVDIYYVTRCYQTRHGKGWMSKEGPIELVNNEEEINVTNQWQREFRVGEIDYDLINYAISIDEIYSPSADSRNLVVTCLDQRPSFKMDYSKINGIDAVIERKSPKT